MNKRIITIITAIAMLTMLLSVSALAVDTQSDVTLDPSLAIDLGPNDPNAIITDAVAPDPLAPNTRSSSLLFSFTGTNVYYMVATNISNKSFTKSDLSNGYLRVNGVGSYSYAPSGITFRAGGCYYNSYSQTFITYPTQYVVFENATYNSGDLSQNSFTSGTIYYGFMTNLIQDGSITLSGTFYLYNAG